MCADELGSIWNSDPVRVTQAIKQVGKEVDREKKKHEEDEDAREREHDSFELSGEHEIAEDQVVKVNTHNPNNDGLVPGSKIDVTVG